MKKVIFLAVILCGLSVNAQTKDLYWDLSGNSVTSPRINFIGTTDNQDLVFKTNNKNYTEWSVHIE